MPTRNVTFDDGRGDLSTARLDLPIDGAPRAFALLVHGFTGSDERNAVRWIVDALSRSGIAVLRIERNGRGASQDAVADTEISSYVEDVVAACGYLDRVHEAPALLVGHSWGGAAVLLAAAELESVAAVATIGAPFVSEHQNAATARLLESLATPLLVLHSPVDNVVGIDDAREIFMAAKHPKSFVSLDAADHFLSREPDARYAGEVIAGWSRRYLTAAGGSRRKSQRESQPEDQPESQPESQPEHSWQDDIHDNRVMVRTEDSLRTTGMANGFGIVLDEPEEVGGHGSGPTPYDYLAAALGACTSMTLRMYADRKAWPLDAVTVEVRHGKVHAEDCEECEEKPAKLDRFERHIRLDGALDGEQRTRLLEIANRCPVHRTLEADVRIETTLRE